MIKEKILAEVEAAFCEKIKILKHEIQTLQASANQETKSSAGDKYETGKAMAHLEIEKLASQLALFEEQLPAFRKLVIIPSIGSSENQILTGKILDSSLGLLFFGINFAKITLSNGRTILGISSETPLAQAILGRKCPCEIQLNQKRIEIKEAF